MANFGPGPVLSDPVIRFDPVNTRTGLLGPSA